MYSGPPHGCLMERSPLLVSVMSPPPALFSTLFDFFQGVGLPPLRKFLSDGCDHECPADTF